MATVVEPVDGPKINVSQFVLDRRPAVELPESGPVLKLPVWIIVNHALPHLPRQIRPNERKWMVVVSLEAGVLHNRPEADLEAERAEYLVHEHVGAFQVVGHQKVELALIAVRVHVAAVVPDEAPCSSSLEVSPYSQVIARAVTRGLRSGLDLPLPQTSLSWTRSRMVWYSGSWVGSSQG